MMAVWLRREGRTARPYHGSPHMPCPKLGAAWHGRRTGVPRWAIPPVSLAHGAARPPPEDARSDWSGNQVRRPGRCSRRVESTHTIAFRQGHGDSWSMRDNMCTRHALVHSLRARLLLHAYHTSHVVLCARMSCSDMRVARRLMSAAPAVGVCLLAAPRPQPGVRAFGRPVLIAPRAPPWQHWRLASSSSKRSTARRQKPARATASGRRSQATPRRRGASAIPRGRGSTKAISRAAPPTARPSLAPFIRA